MTDIDELLQHDAWLRGLVRQLVGESEVDDVLQRTMIAAMRQPPRQPGALRAWLRRVAGNVARAERRAAHIRRRKEAEAAIPADRALPSTEETVHRLAAQRAVTSAVTSLPEPYRTAVLLVHYHGLSAREAAERLGVTPTCLRQRVHRGLESIRARLSTDLGPEWRSAPALLALMLPRDAVLPSPLAPPIPPVPAPTALLLTTLMNTKLLVGTAALLGTVAVTLFAIKEPAIPIPGDTTEAPDATSERAPAPLSGHAPGVSTPRTLDRQPVAPADLEPKSPAPPRLAGRVLDPTGRPLPGVPLGTRAATDLRRPLQELGLYTERFAATAESDADGRFALPAEGAGPEIAVGPGFFNVRSSKVDRRPASALDILVIVAPAVRLDGVVRGPDGMPLSGVTVRPVVEDLTEFPEPLDRTDEHPAPATTTGDDGRFTLPRLPAGITRVEFSRVGYLPLVHEVGRTDAVGRQFELARRRAGKLAVCGRVLDASGQPVGDAVVGLRGRRTHTDAQGTWRLEFDPEADGVGGRPHLYAARTGFQTAVRRDFWKTLVAHHETPDAPPLRVDLDLAGASLSIAGKVVNSSGWPKSGVQVVLWGEAYVDGFQMAADLALGGDAEAAGATRAKATTGFLGGFEIKGLSKRSYRLHFFDDSTRYTWTSDPIEAGTAGLVIRMPKDLYRGKVIGRVLDEAGQPVAAARISISGLVSAMDGNTSWVGNRVGETDADGRFTLANVPASLTRLAFGGAGYIGNTVELPAGAEAQELTVRIERSCYFKVDGSNLEPLPVEFTVLDAAGKSLYIRERSPGRSNVSDRWRLERGKSEVLSTRGAATTVVLFGEGGAELGRVPVRLVPGTVTTVRK